MRIHPLFAGHGTPARQPLSRTASFASDQFFDADLVEQARAQAVRLGGDLQASASRTLQDRLESLPLTRALMRSLGTMAAQHGRAFVLRLDENVLLTRHGFRGHDGVVIAHAGRHASVSTWTKLDVRAFARIADVEALLMAAAGRVRECAASVDSPPPRERANAVTKGAAPSPTTQPMLAALAAAESELLAMRRAEAQPRIFARALATTLEPTPFVQALMRSLRALDDAYGARHALHVFGHKRGLYLTATGFRKGRDPVDRWSTLRWRRRGGRRQRSMAQGVLPWHVHNTRNLDGRAHMDTAGVASVRADGRGKYHIDVALEDEAPVYLDWHRHKDVDEALRAVEGALGLLAGHVEEHAAITTFGSQVDHAKPVESDLLPTKERHSEVASSLVKMAQEEAARLESLVIARQRAPQDFVAFLHALQEQPLTQSVMKSLDMLGRVQGYPVGLHDEDLPVVLTPRGFCTLLQGSGLRAAHIPHSWGPYYWTALGAEALPWFHTLDDAKRRIRTMLADAAVDVEPAAKRMIGRAGLKDRLHVWWER